MELYFKDRIRKLDQHKESGDYILYWMRSAIRIDHNPALLTALEIAEHLELPMFIYHGLSEKYPFASLRHHTFIYEGAEAVSKQCASYGLDYFFHVERTNHRGSHLITLVLILKKEI